MGRIIAHVDMDCFFCACEEKKNPSLKSKPVIVGSTGTRGVVSTSNYEAREFGVYSATPISIARKLCPNGIFLPVDYYYYREESYKIMLTLKDIGDDFLQVSVDEAYIDVTTLANTFGNLDLLGKFIQKKVYKKTKLTCSVGIANSRKVAKIASDFKKPNGVTVVENAKEFLSPLDIKKIPGVGKKSVDYYRKNGINTIGDLAKLDTFKIIDLFGKHGIEFQKLALGEDRSKIEHIIKEKSSSREHTFTDDEYDRKNIKQELLKLSKRVHEDLRNRTFKTVSLKLRYSDFTTITRDFSFSGIGKELYHITEPILTLFEEYYDFRIGVRLVGVKVSRLSNRKEIQTRLDEFFK